VPDVAFRIILPSYVVVAVVGLILHRARVAAALGRDPVVVRPFAQADAPYRYLESVLALGAFDMAAIQAHGKAWIAIAPADQDAILRTASTADATTAAMRVHFEILKGWIAGAYYSSEPGMRELGWTGNMLHRELPGCTHPGGHQD